MANFPITFLCSLTGCLGFTIAFNLKGRTLILSSIGGGIGWCVFVLCQPLGNDILQFFFATIAISIYAEIMSRVCKMPVTVFLIIGLLPLVPGSQIYYAMEYCINGNIPMFVKEGLHTFFIAGSLAVGIIFVSSIVKLMHRIRSHLSANQKIVLK